MPRRILLGSVLLVVACAAPKPDAPRQDPTLVRAQLDSLWVKYTSAAVAGDGDAIARLYVDSLYIVESGLSTVRGMTQLRSVLKEVLGGVRFQQSTISPEFTEVVGDHALQFGAYLDVIQPTGQPVQSVFGRFSAVFQQDSAGSWRISRLIAVADSTVAQPVKPE